MLALGLSILAPVAHAALAPQDMVGLRSFGDLSLSRDGNRLLATASGDRRPTTVIIDVKTGAVLPSGNGTSVESAIGWFPQDDRILVARDVGANEATHIFVRDPDGSERDMTPAAGAQARFLGWARDGRSFFLSTNERDPTANDLYEIDAASFERRERFRGDGYMIGRGKSAAISPAKDLVAAEKILGFADNEIRIIEMATGKIVATVPSQQSANLPLFFSDDGSALYFLSDAGREYTALCRLTLADGSVHTELALPDGDIRWADRLSDGGIVVTSDRQGRAGIRVHRPGGGADRELPLPAGAAYGMTVAHDGRHGAFTLETPSSPGTIQLIDFTIAGAPKQLRIAGATPPRRSPAPIVRAVSYASFDGMQIPAIAYQPPAGVRLRGALVWLHGGPSGQSGFEFNPLLHFLSSNGYAIYAANLRGSNGYGKTFRHLDDLKQGEANIRDVVAARQAMIDAGLAPGGRVGVIGGSFGGYHALMAATQYPEAWSAVIDLFGPTDWDRSIRSMPVSWAARRIGFLKKIGDPAPDDGAYLRSISPIFQAQKIRAPLLVLQGTDDQRVLRRESDDLVKAVQAAGTKVEYVVLEGEGHGWPVRPENQITAFRRLQAFVDAHVGKAGAP